MRLVAPAARSTAIRLSFRRDPNGSSIDRVWTGDHHLRDGAMRPPPFHRFRVLQGIASGAAWAVSVSGRRRYGPARARTALRDCISSQLAVDEPHRATIYLSPARPRWMLLRPLAVSFGIVVASLMTPLSARAECVMVTAKQVLENPGFELVFSGTVIAADSTGEQGYRVTFDVDRVWKGSVSKRFDLYVSPRVAETPTFELGRHSVAVAWNSITHVCGNSSDLAATDTVAFTPVPCTDSASLSPSFIQDMGPSKPPNQSAGQTQELAAVTDREAYAIYALLVPKEWARRSKICCCSNKRRKLPGRCADRSSGLLIPSGKLSRTTSSSRTPSLEC